MKFAIDDHVIHTSIRPTQCGGCGHIVTTAFISFEVLFDELDGSLEGITSISLTPCCGHKAGASVPPEHLARTFNALAACRKHKH